MLADLPKLFDRNFVTGYLLPALLFGFASVLLVSLSFGWRWIPIELRPTENGAAQIVVVKEIESSTFLLGLFIFACLALSILLLVLNRFFVRFLEGYYAPISWLKSRAEDKHEHLEKEKKQVEEQYIQENNDGGVTKKTKARYRQLTTILAARYPYRRQDVLPTELGNVIRSAETYSHQIYGFDLIPIWPRLIAVVDEDFRSFLDNAKSSLDFAVNIFFLGLLLSAEIIAVLVFSNQARRVWVSYAVSLFLLALLQAGIYRVAISRAYEWGQFLRATADLYWRDLLKKLGLSPPPTAEERRALWQQLNRTFLYHEPYPVQATSKTNPLANDGNGRQGPAKVAASLLGLAYFAVHLWRYLSDQRKGNE